MKLTFFGTGTSMGIPLINCDCPVCQSGDPRDKRLRSGARLEIGNRTVLIDASSDLRQQVLTFGLERLDGIFVTHSHADHIFGLDDTRIFSLRNRTPVRIFASEETRSSIRRLFWYAFDEPRDEGLVKPVFQLLQPEAARTELGIPVTPIPLMHGTMPTWGFRFGALAYLTDFNVIDDDHIAQLNGLDTLVLGALRFSPSISHLTVPQAIDLAVRIGARMTYLTHFTHEICHRKLAAQLPEGIRPAYDGLEIVVPEDPNCNTMG